MPAKVYLSRRNLLTLLSKLDRAAKGEETACTIIKTDNVHPKYPQSMKSVAVKVVEGETQYTSSPSQLQIGRKTATMLLGELDLGVTVACINLNVPDQSSVDIYAVENDAYYAERRAGAMHPSDEPKDGIATAIVLGLK